MLLDDGWRVLNGQVPHRDFFSPLGPLEFWIVAGGMLLVKGGAQGIAIGIAAFGFAIGLWGWFLSRRRLPALFSLLITTWLVLYRCIAYSAWVRSAVPQLRHDLQPPGICAARPHSRGVRVCRGQESFLGRSVERRSARSAHFLKLNFFGVGALMLLITVPLTRAGLTRIWSFGGRWRCVSRIPSLSPVFDDGVRRPTWPSSSVHADHR